MARRLACKPNDLLSFCVCECRYLINVSQHHASGEVALQLRLIARIVAVAGAAVLRGFSMAAALLGLLLVAPSILDRRTLASDPHGGAFMTLGGILLLLLALALWVIAKVLGLASRQPTSRPAG